MRFKDEPRFARDEGCIMHNHLFRAAEAAAYLSIGESTYWRWVKLGILPRGIHLSPRCTVWRKSDLDEFISSKESKD